LREPDGDEGGADGKGEEQTKAGTGENLSIG
jgi:hypothetical protein